jgi:hypothetical protein
MAHVFEPAASGRAKCRGCGKPLPKGEIRFGEKLANPFAEGEMTHWFHPLCAAYTRPEAMLEALQAVAGAPARESLEQAARDTVAFAKLARIDGAERAPGGQARCRQCKELIEKGGWRIRLVFHEEGTFSPGGFIHLACRAAYFEGGDIAAHVLHFSPALDEASRAELKEALGASAS